MTILSRSKSSQLISCAFAVRWSISKRGARPLSSNTSHAVRQPYRHLAQRLPLLGGALARHSCDDRAGPAGGLRRGWDRPDAGAAGARDPAQCSRFVFSGAQEAGRGRGRSDRCCGAVRRAGRPHPHHVGGHAVLRPLAAGRSPSADRIVAGRRRRAECARRVGSHRSDRHAPRESGRHPGGRCPALCGGRPEQDGEDPGSCHHPRGVTHAALQRRQAGDGSGCRSSRPAPSGQERCGGSAWCWDRATAAGRRARTAEVLGAHGRPGHHRAGRWAPRDHRHRLHRRDLHSDAARGPARQVHTPLWLKGSAPNDNRDGRCGPPPQPLLRVAAGRKCLLRCGDRSGTLADRCTVRSALGGAGLSAPVCPIRRAAAGGRGPAHACGGSRSRLVDDHLRSAVVRDHRTSHRVCRRTTALRPLHRTVAHVGHCRGRLLDVDLGPGGLDPLHASHALPRRDGAACQSARVLRRTARRQTCPVGREPLLPAHARQ